MQRPSALKQVVRTVTTGLYMVNFSATGNIADV
jgi:hypothetical protein